MGCERLHPDARAGQGRPIGFVPARDVQEIADWLGAVTVEQLREHYHPPTMYEMAIYKIHAQDGEFTFQYTWNEFQGMQAIYRAAADHHEAMITVID